MNRFPTTVVVLSDDSSHTHRFLVRRWHLWALAVVLLSCVSTVTFLATGITLLAPRAASNDALRARNQELGRDLTLIRSEYPQLDETLNRLEGLAADLRVRIDIDARDPSLAIGPIGEERAEVHARSAPVSVRSSTEVVDELLDKRARVASAELSMEYTYDYIDAQQDILRRTPSIAPARGWFTSEYGTRLDPYTGVRVAHRGIDIAGPEGTPVIAPADGRVLFVGIRGGYGNTVVIDHGSGLQTHYGHMLEYVVEKGQRVERRQLIGYTGSTGRSTGPHLHYEIRRYGETVDPARYILDDAGY